MLPSTGQVYEDLELALLGLHRSVRSNHYSSNILDRRCFNITVIFCLSFLTYLLEEGLRKRDTCSLAPRNIFYSGQMS